LNHDDQYLLIDDIICIDLHTTILYEGRCFKMFLFREAALDRFSWIVDCRRRLQLGDPFRLGNSQKNPHPRHSMGLEYLPTFGLNLVPMDPITLSDDDWGAKSHPQQGILVPLPFSEGDWIPREW